MHHEAKDFLQDTFFTSANGGAARAKDATPSNNEKKKTVWIRDAICKTSQIHPEYAIRNTSLKQ